MEGENNLKLLSRDISLLYKNYRQKGYSRDCAIAEIREEYDDELHDCDERIAVLSGLVLALCKKNELTKAIANETYAEIKSIQQYDDSDDIDFEFIAKIEKMLNDTAVYGDEAPYKKTTIYKPDWNVGDVFSHPLACDYSEKLGIKGWLVLFYKVGDYTDNFGKYHQLMCVSLCQPDNIPTCYDELKKLGFLPMMSWGDSFEYLAQLATKSKRGENAYELTKIGCFANPDDIFLDYVKKEKPVTTMPLFARLRRNDLWPDYEDMICGFYRDFKSKMTTPKSIFESK